MIKIMAMNPTMTTGERMVFGRIADCLGCAGGEVKDFSGVTGGGEEEIAGLPVRPRVTVRHRICRSHHCGHSDSRIGGSGSFSHFLTGPESGTIKSLFN
jgi:hypothetical protein